MKQSLFEKEKHLKEKIKQLQKCLVKMCEGHGHDFEDRIIKTRNMIGHHTETYNTTGPLCEHIHQCGCPQIQKTRSVADYEEIIITIKKCKRCLIETTTEKKWRP